MSITNNLKPKVDLPVWEWCRFAPTATTAISSITTGNSLQNRYLYYQVSGALYRYDTISDSWQQLASSAITTPTVMNNNVLSNATGHYGRAIGPGSGNNTIQLAGLSSKTLVGYKIRILSGTGAGQERTITAISAPIIHDRGVVTTASTAGTQAIIDATAGVGTKQWKINQWTDYQVRIDFGTMRTHVRPILYNTQTSLFFSDPAHLTVNPWAVCPLPAQTAAGSLYVIESHIVSVDANWDVNPDATSNFVILSGGIWNITQGTTSAPFFSLSYYDLISDVWYQKSTQSGLKTAIFTGGSDLSMERFTESGGTTTTGIATSGGNNTLTNSGATMIANQFINMTLTITGGTGSGQAKQIISNTSTQFTVASNWTINPDATSTYSITGGQIFSGIATSGSARSLTDSTLSLTPMQYANFELRIIYGTGRGQSKTILSNTATAFNFASAWDVTPDNTSVYSIYRDTGKLMLIGGGDAGMLQYSAETDQWTTGKQFDHGQTNQLAATKAGQRPFALTSITRTVTGMVSTGTIAAPGSSYNVDDILTVAAKGGTLRVTSVNSAGGVTGVSLETCGTTYTAGVGQATTVTPAGGSGCTITLAAGDIDFTELVATPIPHNFKIGDSVTISGANGTGAAKFNGTYTIIGNVSTGLGFSYCSVGDPGAGSATIAFSPSTTVLVDCTKNWTIDEHKGKIIQMSNNVVLATGQARRIVSNTATTITWTLATTAATPANGTWRYVIEDIKPFGTDITYGGQTGGGTEGFATGGSTTTLIDTSKNWPINYWSRTANRKVRIVEGTGVGNEIAITSNTSNTLTFASQAFTPDTTTRYVIMDTFGTATAAGGTTTLTDASQNWAPGQWVGKRVRFLAGTSQGSELAITANAATTLTFTSTANDVSTAYAILEATPKTNGIHIDCIIGSSDTTINNKYLYAWTGTATAELSRFNVNTEHWELMSYFPQTETLTTGSVFCYDGEDRIYYLQGITTTAKLMYYDLTKNIVVPASTFPYGMGLAISGNRMEIVETEDGLKYLYLMRHSSTEMWRILLYW